MPCNFILGTVIAYCFVRLVNVVVTIQITNSICWSYTYAHTAHLKSKVCLSRNVYGHLIFINRHRFGLLLLFGWTLTSPKNILYLWYYPSEANREEKKDTMKEELENETINNSLHIHVWNIHLIEMKHVVLVRAYSLNKWKWNRTVVMNTWAPCIDDNLFCTPSIHKIDNTLLLLAWPFRPFKGNTRRPFKFHELVVVFLFFF